MRTLREPRFSSRLPVIGPLIVALRRFWNWLSTKWYVQPILQQQNQFNEGLVRSLDELAAMIVELRQWLESLPNSPRRDPTAPGRAGFGFIGRKGEDRLHVMDEASLLAWENASVPVLDRHSDEMEAMADEKLDEEFTLNYPLHWRPRLENWSHLSDLALANEILGCCPGDLVLDLAAGTCWATEFLNRVGIRTVSLDLSREMLRRGRKRLDADRRLQHRTVARFTAGSAQNLPFAGETFDGVLCMNALHHVPSYRQTLREVYRVLKEGGRAVFSEPGAIHAEIPLSKTRMREQGVLEKSVSLPLIHRFAREAGFSRMMVIPLQGSPFYLFEYTATPDDLEVLRQMWEETLRRSPLERARFALQKGARTSARLSHAAAHPARSSSASQDLVVEDLWPGALGGAVHRPDRCGQHRGSHLASSGSGRPGDLRRQDLHRGRPGRSGRPGTDSPAPRRGTRGGDSIGTAHPGPPRSGPSSAEV